MNEEHDVTDVSKASPIAKFFLLNTVFAILMCVLLVIGKLIGAATIVKEGNPDIDQTFASVTTIWPGADPETIENQVTDKLEKELKSLKGLKKLSSASFDGSSLIIIEFRAEAPVAESIALVRAEVDESAAELDLSSDASQPKVEQISAQDTPVLSLSLFGNIDQAVLSRATEDIEELLEKVPNVRKVDLSGDRKKVIHVQLLPDRLLTLNISPTQVRNAIASSNRDLP